MKHNIFDKVILIISQRTESIPIFMARKNSQNHKKRMLLYKITVETTKVKLRV